MKTGIIQKKQLTFPPSPQSAHRVQHKQLLPGRQLSMQSTTDSSRPIGPHFDLRRITISPPEIPPRGTSQSQQKLMVGAPDDRYEQEADRAASQVMNAMRRNQIFQASGADHTPAARQAVSYVQRQPVSPRLRLGSDLPVSVDTEQTIQQERGRGSSLPDGLRQSMEHTFGGKISQVRIHTDALADQMSQSLQARAFTVGSDLFFQRGAYQPNNVQGQRLLAHELSHVIQQRGHAVSIQREYELNQHKTAKHWILTGRPAFKEEVKKDIIKKDIDDGEEYLASVVDPLTKAKVVLPTIHRRHKVAWDLWRSAINQALETQNGYALKVIAKIAKVPLPPPTASHDGNGVLELGTDIFNAVWNLWMGPGDENMEKGGQMIAALQALQEASKEPSNVERNENAYARYVTAVYDPKDIQNYEWDEDELEFKSQEKRRFSIDSYRAGLATRDLIAYSTKLPFADKQVDSKHSVLSKLRQPSSTKTPILSSPYKATDATSKELKQAIDAYKLDSEKVEELHSGKVDVNSTDPFVLNNLIGIGKKKLDLLLKERAKGKYQNISDFIARNKLSKNFEEKNKDIMYI